MADFANRLMPIRSIQARAAVKATLPERFVQLFFEPNPAFPTPILCDASPAANAVERLCMRLQIKIYVPQK